VRPVRFWPGCRSPLARPEGIDLVVVRENLEDLYAGAEGELAELASTGLEARYLRRRVADLAPGRFAIKVISVAGTERIVRFACELARRRKAAGRPGRVSCGTKHNVLPRSDGLFREVALRVAAEYRDLAFESFLADDLARRFVASPRELDVVVLPNLYGDLFSDLAAGVVGGLGLAPSGCYGEGGAYFEPAHGTAPDLAGTHTINPTATILSAAMLLEHLGFADAARRIERAVEAVYAEGRWLTPDQGGGARTEELCEAVADRL
jgi:isocitrate/isopropylmalate dehydrogenase